MNEQEYLEQRLEPQISYYDKKSISNKRVFISLITIQLILGVSVPFLTSISEYLLIYNFVIGLIGVLISLIVGLLAILKNQEKWLKYRTTCEILRHHKYKFLTKSYPYDDTNAFSIFVDNIETNISAENSTWEQIHKKND